MGKICLQPKLAKEVGFLITNETKQKSIRANVGMQLSEKALFIQGVIGETGLEWRISSLTVSWVAFSISEAWSAALRCGHCGRSPEEGEMRNN